MHLHVVCRRLEGNLLAVFYIHNTYCFCVDLALLSQLGNRV